MRFEWDIHISRTCDQGRKSNRCKPKVQDSATGIGGGSASHGHIGCDDHPIEISSKEGVADLLRFSVPISNYNPLKVHFCNQHGDVGASALVGTLVQTKTRKEVRTHHKDRKALSSVHNASVALGFRRLVVTPSSKTRFAQ